MQFKLAGLFALAFLLTLRLTVGSALAYFTAHEAAKGAHPIFLNRKTEIREEVTDWKKHVTVVSTGDAPCFARIRAYCGSFCHLTFLPGKNWEAQDDGWWYYTLPLAPGETSSILEIAIEGIPETSEMEPQDFQVVVVQEHTAVLYREDGTPYPDWNLSAESVSEN